MLFGIFLALFTMGFNNVGWTIWSQIPTAVHETVTRVVMQKPGDPEKIIESEYARLKGRGTREGLELFIARHPDHPLAEKAREDIRRLYE
ncbi:hypothetical protein [Shinella sp. WSJ-2]|uniref:hypothetical protein n=1 Tax=Shinella sp. WSJ-2 TaxID=2303749 RepID=UPI0011C12E84|nr:hypothetical protein [Shinella sp. WSJ-2]